MSIQKKVVLLHPISREKIDGVVAQLVEQRTENPCVTGSIPVNATKNEKETIIFVSFLRLYGIETHSDSPTPPQL